jgi:hypothetical protein
MDHTILKVMQPRFTHLLHRVSRLKQRFEAERRSARNSPFRLLKLRTLILKLEERLRQMVSDSGLQHTDLRPAFATAHPYRWRGPKG